MVKIVEIDIAEKLGCQITNRQAAIFLILIFFYLSVETKQCLVSTIEILQVLETPHRKPVRLGIGVTVNRGVSGIEIAVPCTRARGRRRPKVGVRPAIVETSIGIAVTG